MFSAALLFDLDGTLVDSHHEICLALERALKDVGFRFSFDQVRELVDGSPLEVIWHKIQNTAVDEDRPAYERFAQAYRQHYMRDLGHASSLFPGVRSTLTQLRAELPRTGFSVVSNKSAPSVHPLLARFGIDHCFELALGSGGTIIPPKPHPDLLLLAAERLGARPEACVMIGDTALDVAAGKRAGMRTVAIGYGMAPREELADAGADHLIESFEQLLTLLSR